MNRTRLQISNPADDCRNKGVCKSTICPLDPLYYMKNSDSQTDCKLSREERITISSTHPGILRYGGLKYTEFQDSLRYHHSRKSLQEITPGNHSRKSLQEITPGNKRLYGAT